TFVHGPARLLDRRQVAIAGDKPTELEAKAIVLATGSEPAPLPFMPFDGKQIVSSTEALAFSAVPEHLIVIGGGYIGLELGSVWSRLGAKVTVLEFLPRLLPLNDTEIAGLLAKSLVKQGLEFHLQTRVTGATKNAGQVSVQAETAGKTAEFKADKVLVAVGRRPSTGGLGLKEAGVKVEDKSGKVIVNERYETSVPGIFAI